MVVPVAAGLVVRFCRPDCSPAVTVSPTAVTWYPVIGWEPGTATAGVQVSFTPPGTLTARTSVGPGGPLCKGPLGQPPKPGPPGSPNSAMVTPCRLPARAPVSKDSSRAPRAASAAIFATAGSSKAYVAGKVVALKARPEE